MPCAYAALAADAKLLATRGADVVAVDQTDDAALRAALAGVYGVFYVTVSLEIEVLQAEFEQGVLIASGPRSIHLHVLTGISGVKAHLPVCSPVNVGLPTIKRDWRPRMLGRRACFICSLGAALSATVTVSTGSTAPQPGRAGPERVCDLAPACF